tara:strand:- start:1775 stop:2134 length:360 start_codon:yes stop_codon:yes gene_type:complete
MDDSHDRYIRITVAGSLEATSMSEAISRLMRHPDYDIKHSYWDCRKAVMGMTLSDLTEIVRVFNMYKPETEVFANRSAILVAGEVNRSMVKMFISAVKMFKFNFRVFTVPGEAEAFLCA